MRVLSASLVALNSKNVSLIGEILGKVVERMPEDTANVRKLNSLAVMHQKTKGDHPFTEIYC